MDRILNILPILRNTRFEYDDIETLLSEDYEAGITIIRTFLSKSKDEFHYWMKNRLPEGVSAGKTSFRKAPKEYVRHILSAQMLEEINTHLFKQYTWQDIIVERLKSGRGSAIRGQKRGRMLEDQVESVISKVFDNLFDRGATFLGRNTSSTAKSDFAIPNKSEPRIIIEVKAYGATGSKQTDVIGDIEKIIAAKRSDTFFLLVTDGVTWLERKNDFQKIVKFQNEGFIYRIYTSSMFEELHADLIQMKEETGL